MPRSFAWFGVVLVLALLAPPKVALAAVPPPNDDVGYARAIDVPFAGPIEVTVDNSAATPEAGETHPCGGSTRTVWYAITAPAVMTQLIVVLVEDAGSPLHNLRLAGGRIGLDGTFSTLGCGGGSWVNFQLSAGVTSYIQVMDDGTGGGELRLRFSILPSPSNDSFSSAQSITAFPATSVPADSRAASRQSIGGYLEEVAWCGASARTVWYRFVAPATGRVTVTPDMSLLADPALRAYVQLGTGLAGLSALGCASRGPLTFDVWGGMPYYVQAADVSQCDITSCPDPMLETRGGTISLGFSFEVPPPPPPGPANDDIGAATEVTAFPASVSSDTTNATLQTGETTACGGSNRTVWYRFVAPGTGRVTVVASSSVVSDPVIVGYLRYYGSGFDGIVAQGCTAGAVLNLDVWAGATYVVQLSDVAQTDPAQEAGGGDITLDFSYGTAPPPPNDDIADAAVIDDLPYAGGAIALTGATSEPGEAAECGASGRSAWYRWTPESDGTVAFDLAGTNFGDPHLAIYRATGGDASVSSLELVRCTAYGEWSTATPFEAGQTYFIRASDRGSGGGNLVLSAWAMVRPPAPEGYVDIVGYDIEDAASSGFGGWSHLYAGTITDTGRVIGGSGFGGTVVDESGGWGTLVDGSITASQLFTNRDDTTGTPIRPAITLHLDSAVRVGSVELLGSASFSGAIMRATFEIGGTSAVLWAEYPGMGIQRFDLRGTPLAGKVSDTLRLSEIVLWSPDQFSIAEIRVVPAPPDTEPPVLALPLDVVAEAAGPGGAIVSFEAAATDAVDGTVAVACDPPSGSTFALGTTSVSCTATDAAGNTASGSFEVRVLDTTPPNIVFGSHPTSYTVSDNVSVSCTVTDAVGVVATTCADTTGPAWSFGAGVHTLTASAADAAGNVATATTTFSVNVTYAAMRTLTSQWVWKAPAAAQLNAYLEAAMRAEQKGNLKAETSNLESYRKLLAAQVGKAVAEADAELLISFSREL